MGSIRSYFKCLKWRSLIIAFSAILIGLLFILTPQTSADVICYVAGILLLASGIAAVVSYLASGRLFGSYALVSGICLLYTSLGQGLEELLLGLGALDVLRGVALAEADEAHGLFAVKRLQALLQVDIEVLRGVFVVHVHRHVEFDAADKVCLLYTSRCV